MQTLRPHRGEEGYNLVVLVVAITVLHIALAASLPLWSTQIRREREAEAIFRGLQYAEAIRVFQKRFGRFPTTLEELLEVEPRSIRQLWTDPLSENGEIGFGVLIPAGPSAAGGQQARRRRGARSGAEEEPDSPASGREARTGVVRGVASGGGQQALERVPPSDPRNGKGSGRSNRQRGRRAAPIRGVYVATEGDSIRVFGGNSSYPQWVFTDTLLPVPAIRDPAAPLPSANSDRVGRDFDIPLPELDGPSTQGDDEERQNRRKKRRNRRQRENDER